VAVHSAVPVAQDSVPVWHPALFEQVPPAVQVQFPLASHELAVPLVGVQLAPVCMTSPWLHTATPGLALVEQEVVPVSHPLLSEQAAPEAHVQVPAVSHALAPPEPVQAVPPATFDRPVHTWVPGLEAVLHEKVPVSHPPLTEQGPFATQLQAPPVPQ
jgi:hypothetical protein